MKLWLCADQIVNTFLSWQHTCKMQHVAYCVKTGLHELQRKYLLRYRVGGVENAYFQGAPVLLTWLNCLQAYLLKRKAFFFPAAFSQSG